MAKAMLENGMAQREQQCGAEIQAAMEVYQQESIVVSSLSLKRATWGPTALSVLGCGRLRLSGRSSNRRRDEWPASLLKAITTSAAEKRAASWKPGQSGNPAGRPSLGESYKEIFTATGNLTIGELKEALCRLWQDDSQACQMTSISKIWLRSPYWWVWQLSQRQDYWRRCLTGRTGRLNTRSMSTNYRMRN